MIAAVSSSRPANTGSGRNDLKGNGDGDRQRGEEAEGEATRALDGYRLGRIEPEPGVGAGQV